MKKSIGRTDDGSADAFSRLLAEMDKAGGKSAEK